MIQLRYITGDDDDELMIEKSVQRLPRTAHNSHTKNEKRMHLVW